MSSSAALKIKIRFSFLQGMLKIMIKIPIESINHSRATTTTNGRL